MVRKYRDDCISIKYQWYHAAGIETERIESLNIDYQKQYCDTYNTCGISQTLVAVMPSVD